MNRTYKHQADNFLGATLISLILVALTFGLDSQDALDFNVHIWPIFIAVAVVMLFSYCIFLVKAYGGHR